jgi:hypothetical protein
VNGDLPGLCANAMQVAVGSTVHGTTCGGTQVGESPCQEPGHPDAFLYVDAPGGASLHFVSSFGVSVLAFPTCESMNTSQCNFGSPSFDGGTFDPSDPGIRLFGVERVDSFCGAFTITVTSP